MILNDFLRSIVDDPQHAPDTWLVLADWLEDQGDPRFEPVRLLHQPDYWNNKGAEWRDIRLRELLDVVPPLWDNALNTHFVWIPPGTFWMGGGGGKPSKKKSRIEQGFALGVFPVTQEQWQAIMGNNPSWFSHSGGAKDKVKDISEADLRQFPVEEVSWNDIEQFLVKLNEKERNSGWLYRLPAEAEWEYACRGGATSKQTCSFHFYFDQPSNDLSSTQANFNGNRPDGSGKKGPNLERTTKVGSYRPNALGLYDMHGNVWEWCSDWYSEGSIRVVRGCSWSNNGIYCRAAYRYGHAPSYRNCFVGLRLARVPRPAAG